MSTDYTHVDVIEKFRPFLGRIVMIRSLLISLRHHTDPKTGKNIHHREYFIKIHDGIESHNSLWGVMSGVYVDCLPLLGYDEWKNYWINENHLESFDIHIRNITDDEFKENNLQNY